jgi:hypothetical protein
LTHTAEHYADIGTVIVLVHREELLQQTLATLRRHGLEDLGCYNAREKRWGRVTVASVPTLCRPEHLATIPLLALVIVDEAHHAAAASYRAILSTAQGRTPACRVLGVTATPQRGDRVALGAAAGGPFATLADQITLGELIEAGHLVPPRAWVVDLDGATTQALANLPKTAGEYDLAAVEELLDNGTVAARVVSEWQARAADRRTVVFAAPVAHAQHVAAAFREAGITAETIHGELAPAERARILADLDSGECQVVTSCAVLTEGFDSPTVSCVVLLRPSSYQSTMVQMIGRGLRTVDPARYPGAAVKSDCVVLDFGRSILTHGGLDQLVDLGGKRAGGDAGAPPPRKPCPDCAASVPIAVRTCPLCGYAWPPKLCDSSLSEADFSLVEVDLLLGASPYKWLRLNAKLRVATAIDCWAVVVEEAGYWHAVCGVDAERRPDKPAREEQTTVVARGSQRQCVAAADDWLRAHGDPRVAGKAREWLGLPPSEKQAALVAKLAASKRHPMTAVPANRYDCACLLTVRFAGKRIRAALLGTEASAA